METYYQLFTLHPKVTSAEVEYAFRRFVVRYRVTLNVEEIFTDPQFMKYLNAYLTLTSEARTAHDTLIAKDGDAQVILPTPLAELAPRERTMLMARIALWRREHLEGIHLLRRLLEQTPDFASGWALLGEFFLTINRLEEGIQAYEKAMELEPSNAEYSARLRHARDAHAGLVEIEIEPSPEELLLREERHRRRRVTGSLLALGIVITLASYFLPALLAPGALFVPWRAVAVQAVGVFLVMLGLAYGRLLLPFEYVMLWSHMRVGDRGRVRSYPYGLMLFICAVPSMWLALLVLLVMAFMDEEWPVSPTIMLGICVLITVVLALVMRHFNPAHWTGTLMLGGNVLVLAAMFGWWSGSLGALGYE